MNPNLARLGAAAAASFIIGASTNAPFTLKSPSFADGTRIPQVNAFNGGDCGGKNVSPELDWTGVPTGAKSLALTVFDPDAGHGKGWWHWVAYDLDPSATTLAAGDGSAGTEGPTSFGKPGYGGPCPPVGDAPHHYIFTLYALDESVSGSLSGPDLLKAIDGHVLGKAVLVGRYSR